MVEILDRQSVGYKLSSNGFSNDLDIFDFLTAHQAYLLTMIKGFDWDIDKG
jgi:hypothetical protein